MKLNRILLLCVIIILIIPFQVFAEGGSQTNEETIISDMSKVNNGSAGGGISNVLNIVIRLIQISGTGISIIVVTLTGIKYMLASTGEKADLKKQAVPIVIGCVVLFGAVNLVKIVADVGDGLNGN